MKSQEQFKEGKNDIYWVGSDFKEHLYGIEFKKKNVEGILSKLLPRDMNDAAIMKELAPETLELGDLLAYLKHADHFCWYLCYIPDVEGTLWAVRAYWYSGGGWDVEAISVARPDDWRAGSLVLSRRFSDASEKDTQALRTSDPLDFGLVERFESIETRIAAIEAILKHHNLTSPDVS